MRPLQGLALALLPQLALGTPHQQARCAAVRQRAAQTVRVRREPTFAFVPITHPLLSPFCITPVTQGLEQAGFTYLPPREGMRHIGRTGPGQGKNYSAPTSWRGDEADLVVQYYRTPGDRSGTAELKGLPPDVRAMDSPLAISGRQLVWGVPNASNIGGHKQVAYQAMRRWVQRHGCALHQLRVMPEQYLLSEPHECAAFFSRYPTSGRSHSASVARPPRQFATQNMPKGHGLLDGGVWFLKDGTKHGSRGISLHTNSSSVRAAFGPCPSAGGAAPTAAVAAPPKPKAVGNQKLSWEERKQFWQGSQNAATTHTDFGDRAGVLVQREVPSVLVNGGHKIACRMYMVIVRTDPLLAVWGTSTSYVKVTPELYRAGATDLKSQVSDSFRSTGTDGSGNVDNKAGAAQEGAEGWQASPPLSLLVCGCSAQTIGVGRRQPLSWLAEQLEMPTLVQDVLAPQVSVLFQSLVGAGSLGQKLSAFQIIGVDVGLRPDMTVVEFEGNMAPGWIAKSPAGDDRCVDEPGTNSPPSIRATGQACL